MIVCKADEEKAVAPLMKRRRRKAVFMQVVVTIREVKPDWRPATGGGGQT